MWPAPPTSQQIPNTLHVSVHATEIGLCFIGPEADACEKFINFNILSAGWII
jgi:hypothetical protein